MSDRPNLADAYAILDNNPDAASPGHIPCPLCKGNGSGPFGADSCGRCAGEGEIPDPTNCRACGATLEDCPDFPNHCCTGCYHELPCDDDDSNSAGGVE